MAKKKVNNVGEAVAYVPKPDTKIYVYIQKKFVKLFPIPYKFKSDYQSLIPLLHEQTRVH
jgi:hypothetical protein